jgi:membrane protein implicated in regulation of membrane protease activity
VAHLEPTPGRQPARASPTVELLLRLVGPTVLLAGFASVAVVIVLHPDRYDPPGFALFVALAFALAYAARVVVLIRRGRRRRDGRTDENLEDRHHG